MKLPARQTPRPGQTIYDPLQGKIEIINVETISYQRADSLVVDTHRYTYKRADGSTWVRNDIILRRSDDEGGFHANPLDLTKRTP